MIYYKEYKPVRLLADVPEVARDWRNTPSIRKWCRQHTLLDEYDHELWKLGKSESDTIKMFGVANAANYCGVAGLTSIDHMNRNAEFSLYIEPDSQKKGFGRKALLTLLKHGFEDFNLKRIWGETFEGNPALDMFVDIGMTIEGTQRSTYFRGGRFIDTHIVSMLSDEWFKNCDLIKIPEEKSKRKKRISVVKSAKKVTK